MHKVANSQEPAPKLNWGSLSSFALKMPSPRDTLQVVMGKIAITGDKLAAFGSLGYPEFAAFERLCKDCLTETQGDLLVDFSEVEHMTSAYLGALLELMHSLAERGRGMKVKASPVVRQVMQLTGLSDTITMVE